MIQTSKKLFLISCTIVAMGTAACAPTVANRGNMLEDHQIADVKPQESTRSEVLRALGSPTTKSTFDPNVWYYIGQETQKRGILDSKVVKERIFLVAFNEEGFVDTIQEIDRARMNVPYVRDKTPTHGNEVTLMQQFLGNLGKFNPAEQNSSAATGGGI